MSYDKDIYRQRHKIENMFCRLKKQAARLHTL